MLLAAWFDAEVQVYHRLFFLLLADFAVVQLVFETKDALQFLDDEFERVFLPAD